MNSIKNNKVWSDVKLIQSTDKNVAKFVFTNEKCVAEGVLYKYPTYEERTVMCISTQSGCPVGCRFCGAGDYFVRSLSADEIISQVQNMMEAKGIDASSVKKGQIMFMSMGEPLLNWNALKKALHILSKEYPNFSLLISSIGPDNGIYDELNQLSSEINSIGLQFSVHESTDERRNQLIPFKSKMNLVKIKEAGEAWFASTGRKPFINYCVTPENNTGDDVRRIVELFNPKYWEYTISVVCEREEHVSAANERQRSLASEFMSQLIAKGGSVRMFDPAGQDDIGGGCGQLWFVQNWMKENPSKARPSIGNGLPSVHTPREQGENNE